MPQWSTLYDVRNEPAPIRNEIRGGIAGAVVCLVLLALVWQRRDRAPKVLLAVFLLAWVGFSAANGIVAVRAHRDAQAALTRGDVEVAEGVVQDLVPPTADGGFETFRLGGRTYLVNDGETKTPGLARTSTRGGPVKAGAHLRISSRGRAILRIEELRDVLPAPPPR